jgi:hypothetical protein
MNLSIFFRDNLSKQLEITNVKLKTESLNLNLLQEQAAELEKEKNIMIIEVEALHTDFNGRLALLDSEINTVSLTVVFILFNSLFLNVSPSDFHACLPIDTKPAPVIQAPPL